ncbi:hypothetical protein ACFSSC_06665 [Corynebacterium mendelii]|uniref:Uncharacterized protein n=1 Tax=Corynebacterium mendelii TaxID=2765362 RepID=A0A939E3Y8_9CORY|nr:hypothetical protein [Corynebacterium mendelii]MBN9644987.1 hypothetical protein [Corynebacterium mendelii]
MVREFLGDFPLPDYTSAAPHRHDDCEWKLRKPVEKLARAAWARNSVRNTINSRPKRSANCDPGSAEGCAPVEMRLALAEKRLQMVDLLHQLEYLRRQ